MTIWSTDFAEMTQDGQICPKFPQEWAILIFNVFFKMPVAWK